MTPTPRRVLIVMRHAKTEPFAREDRERQLTPRGLADASAAAEWLVAEGLKPDAVWVSDATRTRQTWDHLAQTAGFEIAPSFEGGLYTAGPESVIDFLRTSPEGAETVLFLGHNPTAAYLTHLLDDGAPDPAAWATVSAGFPTCTMAIFEVPCAWAELDSGTAHLRAARTPH